MQVRGCLLRLSNSFGQEDVKITKEATFSNEDATAVFLTKAEKEIKEKGYHPTKVFNKAKVF